MGTSRFKNPFSTEHELCARFAEHAKSLGWSVFPETSDWDLLLVATDKTKTQGVRVGDQIGVEAKLRDNVKVLSQAIPRDWDRSPNYYAVLVPRASSEFLEVARRLRVDVFTACKRRWRNYVHEWGVDFTGMLQFVVKAYRHEPEQKCWHPEYEVWTPPGVAAPCSITPWKIKAVELCHLLRERGYLTAMDFRKADVSMTRWRNLWLTPNGKKKGRFSIYVARKGVQLPDELYPGVSEALEAA
jgi:hypothetical protein